jgi:hypothetical protein
MNDDLKFGLTIVSLIAIAILSGVLLTNYFDEKSKIKGNFILITHNLDVIHIKQFTYGRTSVSYIKDNGESGVVFGDFRIESTPQPLEAK